MRTKSTKISSRTMMTTTFFEGLNNSLLIDQNSGNLSLKIIQEYQVSYQCAETAYPLQSDLLIATTPNYHQLPLATTKLGPYFLVKFFGNSYFLQFNLIFFILMEEHFQKWLPGTTSQQSQRIDRSESNSFTSSYQGSCMLSDRKCKITRIQSQAILEPYSDVGDESNRKQYKNDNLSKDGSNQNSVQFKQTNLDDPSQGYENILHDSSLKQNIKRVKNIAKRLSTKSYCNNPEITSQKIQKIRSPLIRSDGAVNPNKYELLTPSESQKPSNSIKTSSGFKKKLNNIEQEQKFPSNNRAQLTASNKQRTENKTMTGSHQPAKTQKKESSKVR